MKNRNLTGSLKKQVVSVALVIVFAFFALACNNTAQAPKNSQKNSQSIPQSQTQTFVPQNRLVFSIKNLAQTIKGLNASQIVEKLQNGTLFENAKGYMVGDVVNDLIIRLNKGLPPGSNLLALVGFSYATDNNWYSNSSKARTHRVLNEVLSYKLDGSSTLNISQTDLEVFGDIELIYFAGWSNSVNQTVTKYNKLLSNMLHSTLNDWCSFLSGNSVQQLKSAINMVKDATVGDVSAFLQVDNSRLNDVAIADIIKVGVCQHALTTDYYTAVCLDFLAKENLKDADFETTFNVFDLPFTMQSALMATSRLDCTETMWQTAEQVGLSAFLQGVNQQIVNNLTPNLQTRLNDFVAQNSLSGDIKLLAVDQLLTEIGNAENAFLTMAVYGYKLTKAYATCEILPTQGTSLTSVLQRIFDCTTDVSGCQPLVINDIVALLNACQTNDFTLYLPEVFTDNEVVLKQKIETFNQENQSDVSFETLYQKAVLPKSSVLSQAEIEFLQSVAIFDFINADIKISDNLQNLYTELENVDLYELFTGMTEQTITTVKTALGQLLLRQ